MPRDTSQTTAPILRKPEATDGAAVWSLIKDCEPLDTNSMYCNLLQCDHFADTSILAELDGDVVGWISAYIVPNEPETLFVWQVAVSERARGMGLAGKLLQGIVERPECADVTTLKTTITGENEASWALFRKFAEMRDAPLSDEEHFHEEEHFDGRHATEHMVTIGPFGELKQDAGQAAA